MHLLYVRLIEELRVQYDMSETCYQSMRQKRELRRQISPRLLYKSWCRQGHLLLFPSYSAQNSTRHYNCLGWRSYKHFVYVHIFT